MSGVRTKFGGREDHVYIWGPLLWPIVSCDMDSRVKRNRPRYRRGTFVTRKEEAEMVSCDLAPRCACAEGEGALYTAASVSWFASEVQL